MTCFLGPGTLMGVPSPMGEDVEGVPANALLVLACAFAPSSARSVRGWSIPCLAKLGFQHGLLRLFSRTSVWCVG